MRDGKFKKYLQRIGKPTLIGLLSEKEVRKLKLQPIVKRA